MNRIVLIIFGVLLLTGTVAMACHVFYEFKTGEDFRIYLPWTNDGKKLLSPLIISTFIISKFPKISTFLDINTFSK